MFKECSEKFKTLTTMMSFLVKFLYSLWRPISPETLNAIVAIYILVFHNKTMFSRASMVSSDFTTLSLFAILTLCITFLIISVFSYFGFIWIQKLGLIFMLILSSITSYYTESLGIIFDEEMVNNVLSTNATEGAALISVWMIVSILLHGVLPASLVLACQIKRRHWIKNNLIWISTIIVGILSFKVVLSTGHASFVKISRGDMNSITYALQPSAFLVSAGGLVKDRWRVWGMPFLTVGADAKQGIRIEKSAKPVVLFLIVGETARSQNQQLDGYKRETNPRLSTIELTNFGPTAACATSTIPALRCMFSKFNGNDISYEKFATHENLLDVFEHADLQVEWYDNDWTFAEGGVTNRIEVNRLFKRNDLEACKSGECYDSVFFDFFDQVIAETVRSKVVVIHLVGSHFPYYRRYPLSHEVFTPSCKSPVLSDCSPEEIVNAYDNSIRYTDFIISEFIEKLDTQNNIVPALVYTSDHGESLGEDGLYLHSTPMGSAPLQQTQVPFFIWMSAAYQQTMGVDTECLKLKAQSQTSHDNFFHTALGLMDVQTTERLANLDLLEGCNSIED